MRDNIFEVEHHPDGDVIVRFKAPLFWALSDATRQHLLAAQEEMLLALRSIIDRAVEKTEGAERTKTKRKTKIDVQ